MDFEVGQEIEEFGVVYKIQMWNVSDILQNVTESADFPEFDGSSSSWAYLIASKAGDYHSPILAQKILDEGFTTPICIYRNGYGGYGVGNGHHRLVCAILLGMDEIPVLYTDTNEYYPDASDGVNISDEDREVADYLYTVYAKIFKKLYKEETESETEEIVHRFV